MALEQELGDFVAKLESIADQPGWYVSQYGAIRQSQGGNHHCPMQALKQEDKLPRLLGMNIVRIVFAADNTITSDSIAELRAEMLKALRLAENS
jgi:hypothetical protein